MHENKKKEVNEYFHMGFGTHSCEYMQYWIYEYKG